MSRLARQLLRYRELAASAVLPERVAHYRQALQRTAGYLLQP